MENSTEDIIIVGAGIAGLSTALALHRLGIKSLVLEASETLRTAGFALATWTNAWKALDAIGLGDLLRQHHQQMLGLVATSMISGERITEMSFVGKSKSGDGQARCIRRNMLLEALEEALPSGTIRCSSKVVSIEELDYFKLVHLADGSVLKTKVLIGCDGVNSVVAKWLGFNKPASTGRSAIRALATFEDSHGFEPKFQQFFGKGFRAGLIPCDDKVVYWFFTWSPSRQEEVEENPGKLKQLVLTKFEKMPDHFRDAIIKTRLDNVLVSPLKYRYPWELLKGNISKGNVCVAGDAFHPMTPDIGQGACSALEDAIVLAKCLAEALMKNSSTENKDVKQEYERFEMALKKYAKERRWRAVDLITVSYIVGFVQQSSGNIMTFLRDKVLAPLLAHMLFTRADYDCGNLAVSSF